MQCLIGLLSRWRCTFWPRVPRRRWSRRAAPLPSPTVNSPPGSNSSATSSASMPSSPAASPSQPPPVHHHQESQIERHLGSTWAAFAFLTFEAYESGWGTFWTADYSRFFFIIGLLASLAGPRLRFRTKALTAARAARRFLCCGAWVRRFVGTTGTLTFPPHFLHSARPRSSHAANRGPFDRVACSASVGDPSIAAPVLGAALFRSCAVCFGAALAFRGSSCFGGPGPPPRLLRRRGRRNRGRPSAARTPRGTRGRTEQPPPRQPLPPPPPHPPLLPPPSR